MSTESKASPTVLVLEDDPNLREMFVLVLRDAGYLVAAVESVSEALDVEGARGGLQRVRRKAGQARRIDRGGEALYVLSDTQRQQEMTEKEEHQGQRGMSDADTERR